MLVSAQHLSYVAHYYELFPVKVRVHTFVDLAQDEASTKVK